MRKEIFNQEMPLDERTKLIKKLWKVDKSDNYPEGFEFAFQVIYLKDDIWIRIVRIDNQMHENRPGTHIHILSRERVLWENIEINEVEDKIIDISRQIIKKVFGDL